MIALTRLLGWAGNIMLLALLADGVWSFLSLSAHVRWGLATALFLPIVYLLPYFHLIGLCGRLKALAAGNSEWTEAHQMALRLKSRLLVPALVTVLLCIAGPVLGFLQTGTGILPLVHGLYMLFFFIFQAFTWARSLFVLGISAKLLTLQDD